MGVGRGGCETDGNLLRAARGGDAESLGVLLERHRGALYGCALGYLGYGEEAHDAVHETFLVALGSLDSVREPEAVVGWLFAVLRNVCLMKLRSRREEVPFDEVGLHISGDDREVEERVERLALGDWVWAALGELPEELRAPVMLRYFTRTESYAEIAAVLGVAEGTVASRLSRAKARLADALLDAASGAHSEERRERESRAEFFRSAYDEYNAGVGYGRLVSGFSEDLVLEISGEGVYPRGYDFLVEESEGDLSVGTSISPGGILISGNVVVLDCDVGNPPDDPTRCPPAFSQVAFVGENGKIDRMRWHLAPRPPESSGWWENRVEELKVAP